MTNITRLLAAGSVAALMATFSMANAADRTRDRSMGEGDDAGACVGVECMPGNADKTERMNRSDDSMQGSSDKDRVQRNKNMDQKRQVDRNDNDKDKRMNSRREAGRDWKYDSKRNHRSKYKDSRYRYYNGGFWYAEPYWTLPGYGYDRVSCGEGRAIVDDSGFNRVRTIECSGRTYTYAALRRGDSYRVSLNSVTGEIVGVRPM